MILIILIMLISFSLKQAEYFCFGYSDDNHRSINH